MRYGRRKTFERPQKTTCNYVGNYRILLLFGSECNQWCCSVSRNIKMEWNGITATDKLRNGINRVCSMYLAHRNCEMSNWKRSKCCLRNQIELVNSIKWQRQTPHAFPNSCQSEHTFTWAELDAQSLWDESVSRRVQDGSENRKQNINSWCCD